MTPETPIPPLADTSERATRRTLRERRWRVVRSVLTVVVVTLLLLMIASLNRDQQAVEACKQRAEYMVKAFQENCDKGMRAPSELPLQPQDRGWREHYVYNWMFTESHRPEVGVCCCHQAHTRLFQVPRREVIIFDTENRTYRLLWLKESEFVQRADELGLRVRVEP